jgi:hypothetical protein
MKKLLSIICIFLYGCAGTSEHTYKYEIKDFFNTKIKKNNTCIMIDNEKTIYERGTKMLSVNPFVGEEGYSASKVEKEKHAYNHNYNNENCENPIYITRQISISGLIYPDTCNGTQYAGSIPMGGNTYTYGNNYGGFYYGNSITNTYNIPIYNSYNYSCTQARYFTQIKFFEGKKYIGKIEDEYWNSDNTDETIETLTKTFISKLEQKENTKK